ncbi:MAG: PIN domain-containing protein [candidate division WOR-3 bacterium]|nr:PIN domain-containing protein [candidate division WOR-3 bacterium]
MTGIQDKAKLLLVDYENVQQIELSGLDDSFRVIIFVGADQKSVPFDLVTKAQKLGSRVEWQKITGNGSNALDFFIACQLGRVFEKSPRPECTVLSKDKGFDPLLTYLNANGLKCKRINSLAELHHKTATSATPEEPNLLRVVEVLGKSEKRSRPRKRKTLSQCISAMFQKKIQQQEVDRIINVMLANGLISEAHNTITYEF